METITDNDTGRPLRYRAIHRRVLVVYTEHQFGVIRGSWAAYVVPVPGENHEKEVQLWRAEGSKLSEDAARALFSGLTEEFDNRGLKWRA